MALNTLKQDTTIPIYLMLQYEHNMMKFPVNPESLKMDIDSASGSAEIEGIGEVSVTSKPKLAKLNISSLFWHDVNVLPATLYVNWIKKWQKSKKPAKFVATRFNYSMTVTCEHFDYETRAGEEEDVYFNLQLKEYRPYGARRLNALEPNATLRSKIKELLAAADSATLPVLVEIPRPARSSNTKEAIGTTFKVMTGFTTLCAITKKYTGGTAKWKELFDANKESNVFGDCADTGKELALGTEIIIPESWRN